FLQGNSVLGSLTARNALPTYLSIPGAWGFSDLTTAPDGTVWIAGDRTSGGFVAALNPSGQLSVFNLDDSPSDIAVGTDGRLWVGGNDGLWRVSSSGGITKVALPGVTALDLRASADGSLWFIDNRNPLNPIAHLGAEGRLEEFSLNNIAGAKV